MRDITPGMRVKIRGFSSGGKDIDGLRGRVLTITPAGNAVVKTEKGNLAVKPSQCLILNKKEWRTYWVGTVVHSSAGDYGHHWTPMVAHEKKPKEPLDANGAPWFFVREEKSPQESTP